MQLLLSGRKNCRSCRILNVNTNHYDCINNPEGKKKTTTSNKKIHSNQIFFNSLGVNYFSLAVEPANSMCFSDYNKDFAETEILSESSCAVQPSE